MIHSPAFPHGNRNVFYRDLSASFLLAINVKELEEAGFSKAADTIYRFEQGLMKYRASPPEHWKKIRATNLPELIHKEVKRRTKKVGAFPNERWLHRLAASILIDIKDDWIIGNRYLSVKNEIISLDTEATDFTGK